MEPGFLYALTAFAFVWVVLGGYLLYMARRARAARDSLSSNPPGEDHSQ